MSKKLVFPNVYKINLLTEELFADFPEWLTKDSDGKQRALAQITHTLEELILFVPEETLVSKIVNTLNKHDPSKLTQGEIEENEKLVSKNSGLEKLKVLGLTQKELESLFI